MALTLRPSDAFQTFSFMGVVRPGPMSVLLNVKQQLTVLFPFLNRSLPSAYRLSR